MWINTASLAVYRTHAEIRAAFPNTSFPSVISEVAIQSAGLTPLVITVPPAHDPVYQAVEEQPPAEIDGVWTQQWAVRDLDSAELEAVRADLHEQRRNARTDAEMAGFIFQDKRIDSDRDSILRITQAALLASQALAAGQPFAVEWVCADDTVLELDSAGMLAMQAALTAHGLACHNRSQVLRELIDAAADGPALSAVANVITTGWPE